MGGSEKMKPQVQPDHYFENAYDSKGRFISYWHQIYEITVLEPQSILEVGIGNGLTSHYLKQRGLNITTIDIDAHLRPDINGSILDIPFQDKSFDVVACFEVLEHIPYEKLPHALSELHRISCRYVILSLPDCSKVYPLYVQIPKLGTLKRLVPLPRMKSLRHRFDGEHYWELGKAGYPVQKIMHDMENAGFEIIKAYRVFEVPYHHFFVLSKSGVNTHG
jgi:SAM-dependent methyltransferase